MELGEKLRQARLEAGLSQKQLCGEEITRNMLSLIENGSAKPSMKTLQYLAARLGKSVSYFLEETVVLSPNQQIMAAVRKLFDDHAFSQAWEVLETYRGPDPIFDREKEMLWVLIRLELAREALEQKRDLYARNLLQQTPVETAYLTEELMKKKLLLLGRISGESVAHQLPGIDSELLLRASESYEAGDFQRSSHLLEAMENRSNSQWHLLRGKVCFRPQQWSEAAAQLHMAEADFPGECDSLLEICYRELGDFQKAYEYACRQRN